MSTSNPLPCNLNATDRPTGCDPPRIVETLADADARDIFVRLEEPMTAADIESECDIATSTLYRKLDGLERAGLIHPVATETAGPTAFVKSMECVSIVYDEPMRIECEKSGLELSCEV